MAKKSSKTTTTTTTVNAANKVPTTMTMTKTTTPPTTATPATSQPPKDDDKHIHNIYNGAKGVWAWGKGLAVVGGAFGLAEGVAQAALGVVGTNLEHVDQDLIEPKLVQPLDSLTAPAVNAVVGMIVKTTDTVVPPVQKILDNLISALHLKRILGQQDGGSETSATDAPGSTSSSSTKSKQENPELTTPTLAVSNATTQVK
eukprot:CAMPEP_0119557036 /NCGR_PEP_ID=MMETSP1352-20130426/8812_1 /TAXON_ID=265584 /ORGANISM="Stauroneis constricta, Strain CCMP1120" /LENGTH=200 /DNA_ID=CAMNT_0007604073 /DNA_START=119 /DNA_END=721 /DNA_ORIENTATION=-